MIDIKNFGEYDGINNQLVNNTLNMVRNIEHLQNNYNKNKQNLYSSLVMVRDSVISRYVGFNEVNIKKHGFDGARKSKNEYFKKDYLEVKNTYFNSKEWRASFSNATYKKANYFKLKYVYLALGVWDNEDTVKFIVFGQDVRIGNYLRDCVSRYLEGSKRSTGCTVKLSMKKLLCDYNFKAYSISKDINDLYDILSSRYRDLPRSKVAHISQIT